MLIEQQKRLSRVRFRHPIRVVTLEGQPRVIRTLTANVSRKGLFLRMPEPLPLGTKVALSLEAGGRALALAQAEVVWGRVEESQLPGRFPGCGVRFTEFMHPRAEELVAYLVHNLDRGKPLLLAPPERRWMRWLPWAGAAALGLCAVLATVLLWGPSAPEADDEVPAPGPALELVAAPPTVRAVEPAPEAPPAPQVEAAPLVAIEVPTAAPVEAQAPEVPVAPPPVVVARAEAPKSSPKPAPGPVQTGTVKLPTGAASSLKWTLTGTELRLSPELPPGAQVTRAFVLSGPSRAVFDISGSAPQRSQVVPASPPYATSVRLGKQASGTRVVVDLDSAPRRTAQDGSALVLTF